MNVSHSIRVTQELNASPAAVWARVSDHEQTHRWVLAAKVKLVSPGASERNGEGAIREVAFPTKRFWSTIRERIVAFEPLRSFSYRVISGMPGLRDHLGKVSIDPLPNGRARISWDVDFDFSPFHPFRMMAGRFTRTFRSVLQEALDELARQFAGQRAAAEG